MANTNKNPPSGFSDLSSGDLKDPTLGRLNSSFRFLYSKVTQLFGAGAFTSPASPTFQTVSVAAQKSAPSDDTQLITYGLAKQLFGSGSGGGSAPASTSSTSSSGGSWQAYTPSVTAAGMTIGSPTLDSSSTASGKTRIVRIGFKATLSGAGNMISFSLPANGASDQQCLACSIDNGGGPLPGTAVLAAGAVAVRKFDGTNFAAGTIAIIITGTYQSQ
jgi:hypothetical protein